MGTGKRLGEDVRAILGVREGALGVRQLAAALSSRELAPAKRNENRRARQAAMRQSGSKLPHSEKISQRQPVKLTADLLHRHRRCRWMNAVRQQHHDSIGIGIDENRRAGESSVTERAV